MPTPAEADMLLSTGITVLTVVVLSSINCGGKRQAPEPDQKDSYVKRKSSEAPAEQKDTKSATGTKSMQKPQPASASTQAPPAALPEAGGDDVGYESCPDMTPEELAKVVAAPK
ncbi:hypothetical protein KIN20_032639 [Parelaphostrongylus tenuis]|uniref:Secreted protein n=1 Tax=Parelaphostrongylus tenuis TaxID=148309 RepID=A0AAD5R7E7_PARTN|nr:hypothetical protein KIN20_032639 [Parelaphostrongylus tenuis]